MNTNESTVAAMASPAELLGAEAPDDRRVDEHVERLDRQRSERRQRRAR